jgi:hypothetical protein
MRDLTTRVVACGEENSTGCFAQPDDMAGSRSRENTVLANKKLLDTIGGTNFSNQLNDLGVPVATITSDDEERTCVDIIVSSSWKSR